VDRLAEFRVGVKSVSLYSLYPSRVTPAKEDCKGIVLTDVLWTKFAVQSSIVVGFKTRVFPSTNRS